ncbi:hypothetical protein B0E46_15715 [Rhodanobacter sp. B04]|nr:hypothetical protein B0E46_15715 [Rhodanobacter sp. B04]
MEFAFKVLITTHPDLPKVAELWRARVNPWIDASMDHDYWGQSKAFQEALNGQLMRLANHFGHLP